MPDILIRDVSPMVVERMKQKAAAEGTSMQALAKRTLEEKFRKRMPIDQWLAMVHEHAKDFEGRDLPDLVELRHAEWEAWPKKK